MSETSRYKQFEQIMDLHPEINRGVGHSLGGSILLEYIKRHPERNLETVTYSAPVISSSGGKRYRHYLDPVSMFDWGATSTGFSTNPHDYHNF